MNQDFTKSGGHSEPAYIASSAESTETAHALKPLRNAAMSLLAAHPYALNLDPLRRLLLPVDELNVKVARQALAAALAPGLDTIDVAALLPLRRSACELIRGQRPPTRTDRGWSRGDLIHRGWTQTLINAHLGAPEWPGSRRGVAGNYDPARVLEAEQHEPAVVARFAAAKARDEARWGPLEEDATVESPAGYPADRVQLVEPTIEQCVEAMNLLRAPYQVRSTLLDQIPPLRHAGRLLGMLRESMYLDDDGTWTSKRKSHSDGHPDRFVFDSGELLANIFAAYPELQPFEAIVAYRGVTEPVEDLLLEHFSPR